MDPQQQQQQPQPVPQSPAYGAPVSPPQVYVKPQPGNGLATAAIVLGIIAFLIGWLAHYSFLASIPAIACGIAALTKHQDKTRALAGIILASISMVFAIGWLIYLVFYFELPTPQ